MELGEPPGRDDGDCRAKARSRGQCFYRLHRVRCAGAQVLEFLDTAWVTPGAFVGAVDLARSWKRGTLRAMDILATAERDQTRVLTASGRVASPGPPNPLSPPYRPPPPHGTLHLRIPRCA